MLTATLLMFFGLWSSYTAAKVLRVLQGKDDEKNKYPFAVSLEIEVDGVYYRHCTGSLIAAEWVLTAAHCINQVVPSVVRFGNMTVPQNETISYRNIIKVFRHPNYQVLTSAKIALFVTKNDIGLVIIEKLEGINLARVSGVDYKSLSGLPVTYAGFGRISVNKAEDITREWLKKPLQIGEGVVTNCHPLEKLAFYPGICVAPKCNTLTDTRRGDSGGPLMFRDTIIGVVSGWAALKRSVFCPASPFLEWINMIMHEHDNHLRL